MKPIAVEPRLQTVTEQLAEFAAEQAVAGLPPAVAHEARRLLVHGMKATIGAYDHSAIRLLSEWLSGTDARGRPAHVVWAGTTTSVEHAALANAAQWFVLLFDETAIGCYVHPTGPVAATALAEGEYLGASGRRVLEAM